MKNIPGYIDAVRIVRVSSIIWAGYLIALAIINRSLLNPRGSNTELLWYLMLGAVALLCLGLSFWPWIQKKLGRYFVPLIIAIITILPIMATWIMFNTSPGRPVTNSEGMVLRLLPFFLVGFLLIAWRYRWPYILLIILCITGLNFAMIWAFPPPDSHPGFGGAFTVPLIQIAVFLAVGFAISFLMTRLKNQQQSLETANRNLAHYASTREQLATSQERNRLARELHDTLAHTLSGLSVQLETLKAYWDVDKEAARSILDKSLVSAHSGLEETRRALKALRASPLEDLGLILAIKSMATEIADRGKMNLEMDILEKVPSLSPDVEQCVYRIAQEALLNTINHAQAKNLTVSLEYGDEKIKLLIKDDGIGFDPEKNHKNSSFGLTGMQERAQLVGGSLNIQSKQGQGTEVQLIV
jgi:signal transduction histidine kinase